MLRHLRHFKRNHRDASLRSPAVATPVGDNPDRVTDGANGLLIPAYDPSLVANDLVKALDSTWARLATEIRRHRTKNGHPRAMADGYDQDVHRDDTNVYALTRRVPRRTYAAQAST